MEGSLPEPKKNETGRSLERKGYRLLRTIRKGACPRGIPQGWKKKRRVVSYSSKSSENYMEENLKGGFHSKERDLGKVFM